MTYGYATDEVPDDVRREAQAQRRRRLPHWCEDCHGHTQPGSPCHEPAEDEHAAEDH